MARGPGQADEEKNCKGAKATGKNGQKATVVMR